ncbi:unnamed protein product [Paramecium pentaurelia]|uniref:Uncharacterized protein n=1 Tax=Paramecium pentaurelia TaxID=43138 RepID=A0A8S1VKQ5_9CILI|nr:unnamed protein product [Paramecium pentaurelia]
MLKYQFLMIRFIFFVEVGMIKMDGLIQKNQGRLQMILGQRRMNMESFINAGVKYFTMKSIYIVRVSFHIGKCITITKRMKIYQKQ